MAPTRLPVALTFCFFVFLVGFSSDFLINDFFIFLWGLFGFHFQIGLNNNVNEMLCGVLAVALAALQSLPPQEDSERAGGPLVQSQGPVRPLGGRGGPEEGGERT